MREALFGKPLADGRVQCRLCPHECVIAEGKRGRCNARGVRDGHLVSLVYGQVAALNVDPIEKKPLYHFYPGSAILSLGTQGCNFSCAFCQNWQLSQTEVPSRETTPEQLVEMAQAHGSVGLAYTYSEPIVAYEFVKDCAALACEMDLKNVLVTNGFIEQEPLAELLPLIQAANVDLKSIRDDFYRRVCGGRLAPVQETLQMMKNVIHLEVTHLLVTGETDSEEDVQELVSWVSEALGKDTPLHLSRYFPQYRFDAEATPANSLERAFACAKEQLDYVYVGNATLDGGQGSNTMCPACGAGLIEREGYRTRTRGLSAEGSCKVCGHQVVITSQSPLP